MIDYSCKLIKTTNELDEIGNDIVKKEYTVIPIIAVEGIYANEFYTANQTGYRPSLRLRVSALNFDDEPMVEYLGKEYDIIRVDMVSLDEVALICERKVGNED